MSWYAVQPPNNEHAVTRHFVHYRGFHLFRSERTVHYSEVWEYKLSEVPLYSTPLQLIAHCEGM